MGKTLGAILTIGAAVAVNFIPGAGQFLSTGLVGTLGSGIASLGVYATTAASIASSLATGLIVGVTSLGLSSLGGVLGIGPGSPKPPSTETAIKHPRPERVSAYGRVRSSGDWITA